MAYVIYSEIEGIFIGSCIGLAFWSKLDPVDQPAAITFPSEACAEQFMSTWAGGRPDGVSLVTVEPDQGEYATIEVCVGAGLPGWTIAEPTEKIDYDWNAADECATPRLP